MPLRNPLDIAVKYSKGKTLENFIDGSEEISSEKSALMYFTPTIWRNRHTFKVRLAPVANVGDLNLEMRKVLMHPSDDPDLHYDLLTFDDAFEQFKPKSGRLGFSFTGNNCEHMQTPEIHCHMIREEDNSRVWVIPWELYLAARSDARETHACNAAYRHGKPPVF